MRAHGRRKALYSAAYSNMHCHGGFLMGGHKTGIMASVTDCSKREGSAGGILNTVSPVGYRNINSGMCAVSSKLVGQWDSS